jgi:hypothetical protein
MPMDLSDITVTCEELCADAKKYSSNSPEILEAAARLEKAHAALVKANNDHATATEGFKGFKGFFRVIGALSRVQDELLATRRAYQELNVTVHRLNTQLDRDLQARFARMAAEEQAQRHVSGDTMNADQSDRTHAAC